MNPFIFRSMPALLVIVLTSCSIPGIPAPEADIPSESATGTEAISRTGYQATGAASECEFIYQQGVYADAEMAKEKTDKIMKFDGKIRKFSMRLPGNCSDRRTSEDKASFFFIQGFFFLPSGTKVAVLDTLSVPCCTQPQMKELVSPEIKRNSSGLDTKLQVFVDDSWWRTKSDDQAQYKIIGYADTLQFDVRDGLTKQNIAQATEEIRAILSTVEELPSETPVFDLAVLDLPKTRVEGDVFILMDKNGGRKRLKVDTKDIYGEISPKEFEEQCRLNCSFKVLVGKKLFWTMNMTNHSHIEVATDIDTGKLISKVMVDRNDIQEKKEAKLR